MRSPVRDELVAHELDTPRPAPRRGSRPARRGSAARPRRLAGRLARRELAQHLHVPAWRSCCPRATPSLAGSSSSSAGSTTTSAPASSPSSFSSGVVNAACAGPRRPSSTISRIPDSAIASIAGRWCRSAASSSGVSASIRATSSATFPLPTTTARSTDRSNSSSWKSGWPLYQATNSVADHEPGRSSPGIAEPAVGLRADGVDDRVVEARRGRRA